MNQRWLEVSQEQSGSRLDRTSFLLVFWISHVQLAGWLRSALLPKAAVGLVNYHFRLWSAAFTCLDRNLEAGGAHMRGRAWYHAMRGLSDPRGWFIFHAHHTPSSHQLRPCLGLRGLLRTASSLQREGQRRSCRDGDREVSSAARAGAGRGRVHPKFAPAGSIRTTLCSREPALASR